MERESIEKQSDIENFFQGKIREMEKMEDFFADEKNIKKDLDSFFAKQVKILHTRPVLAGIKVEMVCLILLGGICVFFGREEGAIMMWGLFFCLLFIAVFAFSYRIYINSKYKYSYSKAKRSFQQLYSDYTDSILKNEIVKSDNNKVIIQTRFAPAEQFYIWFCNDFLLACKIRNYEFVFIRYSDILHIEYYKIQGDKTGIGTVAYNRAVSIAALHDCVKVHYQINNMKKEFKFFTISPFCYFENFAEKGIKVIESR